MQEHEPRSHVAVMNKIHVEINAECQETGYSNVHYNNQVRSRKRTFG